VEEKGRRVAALLLFMLGVVLKVKMNCRERVRA
jgi:hypothetical protein